MVVEVIQWMDCLIPTFEVDKVNLIIIPFLLEHKNYPSMINKRTDQQ